MKALQLKSIGELVLSDLPRPVPGDGEVLLKIRASGVCGSDIPRIYKKGTYKFPTVPGHEFSGEIIETGSGADFPRAVKAAVFPLLPCKKCDMCLIGEYASCKNYDYFGSRRDGGFAEYLCAPVWNLILNDNLSYEELALAEPAAVAVHALDKANVSLGDTVAIFGAGAIGLMLAEFAKARGASKTILFDVDEKKLAFAKQNGHFALNSSDDEWINELHVITRGAGVDVAIDAAGVPQSVENCLIAAKPLGRVVLMGNPSGDMNLRRDFYWEILRKQLTLHGTWNSSYSGVKNDWRTAIDAMESKKVDLKYIISHRFAFDEYVEAFDLLNDKSRFSCRVMFINK